VTSASERPDRKSSHQKGKHQAGHNELRTRLQCVLRETRWCDTHMTLIRGLQMNGKRGVGWVVWSQSKRFVYDATISGVESPELDPEKWSICYLSMGCCSVIVSL